MTRTAAICFTLIILLARTVYSQSPSLPRSTPELQGVSSNAILEFVEAAEARLDSMHSFMMVRHGNVVAECWWKPYDATTRHQLYSLSKSFTSTAVGLAISEGKLSLDDEVIKFFPDELPESPSANLKSMRVRDLLSMTTGHDSEPMFGVGRTPWTKAFLAHPVVSKPGTQFVYNTPATYMCSAIVQKQTGKSVLEYLGAKLFEPLGIKDPTWGTSPQGISLGGYALAVRTEDIAKFGQLYLQKGKWGDQQLVPSDWVEMATSRQTPKVDNPRNDWDQGYGFQFWRSQHNSYRGDGAFGQYCIVIPEQDTVIAITSGVKNMQNILGLVWEKLLPALSDQPLPNDETATKKMQTKLASLSLPTVAGRSSTDQSKKLTGRRFNMDPNDQSIQSATWRSDDSGAANLVLSVSGTEHTFELGTSRWTRSDNDWRAPGLTSPIFTTAAWTGENECTAKVCFVETAIVQTLVFQIANDQLRLDSESNVGFGQTKKPTVLGR